MISIMKLKTDKRKKYTVSGDYTPKVITATCACGAAFETVSHDDIRVDICSQCHPFFTGDSRFVDAAGRIEKFNKKYQKK